MAPRLYLKILLKDFTFIATGGFRYDLSQSRQVPWLFIFAKTGLQIQRDRECLSKQVLRKHSMNEEDAFSYTFCWDHQERDEHKVA